MIDEQPTSGPVFPYKRLLLVLVPAFAALLYYVILKRDIPANNPAVPTSTLAAETETFVVPLQATGPAGQLVADDAHNLHLKQGEELTLMASLSDIQQQGDAVAEDWQLFVAENGQPPVPINANDPLQWTYVANTDVQEAKLCLLHLAPEDNDKVLRLIENYNAKKGKNCISLTIDGPAQVEPQSSGPEEAGPASEPASPTEVPPQPPTP